MLYTTYHQPPSRLSSARRTPKGHFFATLIVADYKYYLLALAVLRNYHFVKPPLVAGAEPKAWGEKAAAGRLFHLCLPYTPKMDAKSQDANDCLC